jgi:uncharacterized membrane protein YeaQ/YmgE (transglycosylase-associated protein family)
MCFDIIVLLVVAAICGSIAGAIGGSTRGGCLVSIALGFVGALLGMWLARLAQLPELLMLRIGEFDFPIIWSIIGASLFVAFLGMFRRRPPPTV